MRRLLRQFIEHVTGRQLTRLGAASFLLLHRDHRDDAWFSLDDVLPALLRQHEIDLVIDVGANEGQFGQRVRGFFRGELHSFEPVAQTFARLAERAGGDPLWFTHQVALGARGGEAQINVTRSSQMASLLPAAPTGPERWRSSLEVTERQAVQVARLDDLLPDITALPGRRAFLKLDTQGFDLEVLEGASGVLDQVHLVLSELSVLRLYDGAPRWTSAIERFEAAGFTVAGLFPIARDAGRIVEFDCLLVRR